MTADELRERVIRQIRAGKDWGISADAAIATVVEACVEEAILAIYQEDNKPHYTKRWRLGRNAHSVDFAMAVRAAIRALSPEKDTQP